MKKLLWLIPLFFISACHEEAIDHIHEVNISDGIVIQDFNANGINGTIPLAPKNLLGTIIYVEALITEGTTLFPDRYHITFYNDQPFYEIYDASGAFVSGGLFIFISTKDEMIIQLRDVFTTELQFKMKLSFTGEISGNIIVESLHFGPETHENELHGKFAIERPAIIPIPAPLPRPAPVPGVDDIVPQDPGQPVILL